MSIAPHQRQSIRERSRGGMKRRKSACSPIWPINENMTDAAAPNSTKLNPGFIPSTPG